MASAAARASTSHCCGSYSRLASLASKLILTFRTPGTDERAVWAFSVQPTGQVMPKTLRVTDCISALDATSGDVATEEAGVVVSASLAPLPPQPVATPSPRVKGSIHLEQFIVLSIPQGRAHRVRAHQLRCAGQCNGIRRAEVCCEAPTTAGVHRGRR